MFVINKMSNLDLYNSPKAREEAIRTAQNLIKNSVTSLNDKKLAKAFLQNESRQNHDFAAIMKAAKRTVERERRIFR